MSDNQKRCPVIAVTGNIGSGKTTVAKIFEEQGALIIDADGIAKALLWNDERIHQRVIQEFGPDICTEDGRISKERLTAKAFQNNDTIQRLNAVIHPEAQNQFRNIIEQNAYTGRYEMIVVDAALIFEGGTEKEYDCVVTVASDDSIRINRIVARDGVKQVEVLKRMKVQASQEDKICKSDYVIYNNSSLSELRKNSLKVFANITKADYVHQ